MKFKCLNSSDVIIYWQSKQGWLPVQLMEMITIKE